MKTAVIGAGPAGMTAAYQLSKAGITVDLYEASGHVGGLARTIELWGMKADIGPHRFFSHDTRINRLWLELAGPDYEMVNRLTRIYYRGRFFHYPLKPFNAIKGLGTTEAFRCLLSFGTQKIKPVPLNGSFENSVTRRFGTRLYEIFFKTYSEKLWGIPCTELDDDFAAQRIKKLSLTEAILNALKMPLKNRHRTLVDCFAYPTGGTGMIYNRMADYIRTSGNQVLLNTPVEKVVSVNGKVTGIEIKGHQFQPYDQVISSMPLSLLVSRLDETPDKIKAAARSLTFRNAIMVYLRVEGKDLFPDNWLYIHSPELKSGRISNFRNWVPQLYGNHRDSVLMLEYWCDSEDEFWEKEDAFLIELATSELIQTGLAGTHKVLEGAVIRIPKCYPVYKRGYLKQLKPVEQFVDGIENLQAIGRFGAFKYNNQDHSMLMGMLAAENITGKGPHDLWAINTDYEDYQERSIITGTGLLKD